MVVSIKQGQYWQFFITFCNFKQGSPDSLDSAFRLTYNMVLNLLRVEEINPEYMLEKSFYQFQHYTAIPELIKGRKDRLFFDLFEAHQLKHLARKCNNIKNCWGDANERNE